MTTRRRKATHDDRDIHSAHVCTAVHRVVPGRAACEYDGLAPLCGGSVQPPASQRPGCFLGPWIRGSMGWMIPAHGAIERTGTG